MPAEYRPGLHFRRATLARAQHGSSTADGIEPIAWLASNDTTYGDRRG